MKKILIILTIILPLMSNAQVFDSSTKATTAQTTYGKVSGYIERGVYTYKGIPYAKAERFMTAQRPDAWTGIRSSRHWGPVNDNDIMPGIFENGSERISHNIPLLIGSTLNEFSTPNIDERVRPAVIQQATLRSQPGDAPVYVYLSAYQVPTMDGNNHACHNSDIPFFFNNVLKSASMTGATKEGIALGDKMSSALINFARTGNPNAKGLPNWPIFTPNTKATMRFDAPKCEVIYK